MADIMADAERDAALAQYRQERRTEGRIIDGNSILAHPYSDIPKGADALSLIPGLSTPPDRDDFSGAHRVYSGQLAQALDERRRNVVAHAHEWRGRLARSAPRGTAEALTTGIFPDDRLPPLQSPGWRVHVALDLGHYLHHAERVLREHRDQLRTLLERDDDMEWLKENVRPEYNAIVVLDSLRRHEPVLEADSTHAIAYLRAHPAPASLADEDPAAQEARETAHRHIRALIVAKRDIARLSKLQTESRDARHRQFQQGSMYEHVATGQDIGLWHLGFVNAVLNDEDVAHANPRGIQPNWAVLMAAHPGEYRERRLRRDSARAPAPAPPPDPPG